MFLSLLFEHYDIRQYKIYSVMWQTILIIAIVIYLYVYFPWILNNYPLFYYS